MPALVPYSRCRDRKNMRWNHSATSGSSGDLFYKTVDKGRDSVEIRAKSGRKRMAGEVKGI